MLWFARTSSLSFLLGRAKSSSSNQIAIELREPDSVKNSESLLQYLGNHSDLRTINSWLTLPEQKITPEQLALMPDSKIFELIGGELVERNVTVLSGLVVGNVRLHAKDEITGESVLPGFRCRVEEFFSGGSSGVSFREKYKGP